MSYKSVWDFGRQGRTNYSVHALGEYPSKIRPLIFHHLVARFSAEQDRILDPFSGSGTLAVEAKLQGRHSVSVDINANAIQMIKEKLNCLTPSRMVAAYDELIDDLRKEEFGLDAKRDKYQLTRIGKEITKYQKIIARIQDRDDALVATQHTARVGDARQLDWQDETFDAIVTDIPYGDMIRYSDLTDDLSTIEKYESFLHEIHKAFNEMVRVLKKGKYLIVFVADNRIGASRRIIPIHADVIQFFLAQKMDLFDLLIWRYYRSGAFRPFGKQPFQTMGAHSYILVFYRPTGEEKYKKNTTPRYRQQVAAKAASVNARLDLF